MQTTWKARAFAAALVASIVLCAALASTASALPARFWGVVPQAAPSGEQMQELRGGGVDSVRIPISWAALQPTRGTTLDWAPVDGLVEEAAQNGIEVLPFIVGAPTWAVPQARVAGSSAMAPAHLPTTGAAAIGWKGFLQEAVLRYGPAGSFWLTHPLVPKQPIRVWQIWNEENFKYFVAHPNPAEYGQLVQNSYTAIKSLDPGAQVILGGMFAEPKGSRSKAKPRTDYLATEFLQQMYRKTPGIKRKFNGVALHPYTGSYQRLTPEIEDFRDVLAENGDGAKGLWITELGWSSKPPDPAVNIFAKGPAGQAAQLKGAFSLLERMQVKWRIQRVYWFSVDDQPGACNFCDGSGLFAKGFVPKRSWYAYVKFAGGTP